MTTWKMMNFNDSLSLMMTQLIFFHEHIMFISIILLSMVMFMFFYLISSKLTSNNIINHQKIEFVWTSIPMLILFTLAVPSLFVLYYAEENFNSKMSVKGIGNQWFWEFEINNSNIFLDQYMNNDLKSGSFRLLDTSSHLTIPSEIWMRILITSNDVIHSFTLPSTGVKIDAIPGRLNQSSMIINKPGLNYGQCSEICGINHSFMPIVFESILLKNWNKMKN